MLIFFWLGQGGGDVSADTHDGFWRRKYDEMLEWATKKPKLEDVIETVKEAPEEALAVVRDEIAIKYPELDINSIYANLGTQRIIAKLLINRFYEQKRSEIDDHNKRILLLL